MTATTKSLLKYVFAFIMLAFILQKVGTDQIVGYLRQIPAKGWVLALVFASFAQLCSALRMRFFFRSSGFPLSARYAVILYYVGAFYNFLLPGGIGGDAYKVILARNRMDMPAKQGIKLMLADRASGLCIVMLTMFFAFSRIDFSGVIPYVGLLLVLASFITIIAYVLFCRWLLSQKPATMLASLPYSLGAQMLWVATLAVIWMSIGNGEHLIEYIAFYCAASITGLLPVSVGGLGIKEITYSTGAWVMMHYLGVPVDAQLGVAISLCMFAMGFLTSLPGLLWLHKVASTDHY